MSPNYPQSTTTFVVTYEHREQRYIAQVCSHSVNEEGDILQHGAVRRDFGPFDANSDVLQWVYREASALVKLMDRPTNLAP